LVRDLIEEWEQTKRHNIGIKIRIVCKRVGEKKIVIQQECVVLKFFGGRNNEIVSRLIRSQEGNAITYRTEEFVNLEGEVTTNSLTRKTNPHRRWCLERATFIKETQAGVQKNTQVTVRTGGEVPVSGKSQGVGVGFD